MIASPEGGPTIPDPTSIQLSAEDVNAIKFLNEKKEVYQNTQKLGSFLGRANEFDAIYVVGGHGPMFDLAFDADSQALIAEFWEQGKVVRRLRGRRISG